MKVVFWGSPAYAADSLAALSGSGFDVIAVYTRAGKISGRGRKISPTPIAAMAGKMGLPVYKPSRLQDVNVLDELRSWRADCFVVVAYGLILPKELLDIPPLGCVNVHPSLLPLYRGASPVASAILDGAKSTGVTLSLLEEGIDSGPVLAQSAEVPITHETRQSELIRCLMKLGAEMLPDTLHGLAAGTIKPSPQNHDLSTVTRRLSKADGRIDWSKDAAHIDRMVRALEPWPGAWTHWQGMPFKILGASHVKAEKQDLGRQKVGTAFLHQGQLMVVCGEGLLHIRMVQLAGARPMSAADFVNGRPSIVDSNLT